MIKLVVQFIITMLMGCLAVPIALVGIISEFTRVSFNAGKNSYIDFHNWMKD